MKPFREAQSKATRAYAQSEAQIGQYHTIVESRVRYRYRVHSDLYSNPMLVLDYNVLTN